MKAVKGPTLPSRWTELHIPNKHPLVVTVEVFGGATTGNLMVP